MKIALISSLYAPDLVGGVERVVQSLAEALPARGHDPVVICVSQRGPRTRELVGPVPVERLALRNVYPLHQPRGTRRLRTPLWHAIDSVNVSMARAVGRVLDREQPDVVHTHNLAGLSALAWSAAADRGIPIVHTLHDYYLLCPRATMLAGGHPCARQHLTCAMYSRPRVALSRHVDAVVGVSRFVLDRHVLHGAFPRATRHVIGNPCRLRAAEPRPARDGVVRIGFLGRIEEAKGIDLLLDAVRRVRHQRWELRIAGRGDAAYEARLEQSHTDPRIRFLGFVDAQEFFAEVDLLVMPSRWHEPLPMVAIEALGAGVPVIAARRGGLTEIVEHGVTGSLFDVEDPDALVGVLDDYLENPGRRDEMRASCRRRANDFAPDRIFAQYDALYRAVASRPLQ